MHIDIVPNRGSPPTVLLRESYREGKKVKKRTLANLSDLPMIQAETIRAILRGETWGPVAERWIVTQSRAHGHVEAVGLMMKRLNVAALIATRPCRERDIVQALIASRILAPPREVGNHPVVAHHHHGRDVWGDGCHGERLLCGHGLAPDASGPHPEEVGGPASRGQWPGAESGHGI